MIRIALVAVFSILLTSTPSEAVDLELFDFNDANGTPLTAAANSANPGNQWFYDEEATVPGDETTGDISTVQSGAYRVITESAFAPGLDSRYLDISNVSSGKVYLSATFRNWSFGSYDSTNEEQIRFTFLDDDTGTSGSTVTAQMQIRRNETTGSMELFGDAIGSAGSFDIANAIDLPDTQSSPFTMVLALDKDSDSFEVFYKDGSNPSQSLGLGGVSRVRDANSIRMVTNNYGVGNAPPFVFNEQANIEQIAVSDSNPLNDLITLEVDRLTGAMTLINTSGASVSAVDSISLISATDSVDLSDFLDFSGTLGDGQSVALDSSPGAAPGLWIRNPVEDVNASLQLSGGGERTIDVNFIGNSGTKWVTGDLNFNGTIDAGDYILLSSSSESDLSGLGVASAYQSGDLNGDGFNDVIDFGIFKDAFIDANGAPAFAQLIATVPEPGSAVLTLLGAITLATRRRRRRPYHASPASNSHTMINFKAKSIFTGLSAFIILMATTQSAQAIIFEEFLFDDIGGTSIENAANNVNPLVNFTADAQGDSADVLTNGFGQLDVSAKNNDEFGTHFVDIEPALTTGTIYGVMELTWDFQSPLDTTQNEEIRISLTNNAPTGTQITGEFRIVRDDLNRMVINGQAGGTGSSNLPDTVLNGGSLVQSDNFIAVVAADLDTSTYEILYSNNDGASFLSAGVGNSSPGRIVEAFRMGLNNDFVNDNVLIDRVYITDELPFTADPDKLTLYVHPKSGFVSIVNDNELTTFDIDYYRVTSGDDSLLEAAWNSLQDQAIDAIDGPDGGATSGDGVGETWTEAGGSDAGVLSESFLLASSFVDADEALPLGGVFDLSGDDQQLVFEYRDASNGNVFVGDVVLAELLPGDFNVDGVVDAADYTVWRDNASGLFVASDYTVWVNNFGATLKASSSTAVPEPSTMLIAMACALAGLTLRQKFCQMV